MCAPMAVNTSFCYEFMKSIPQIATLDIYDLTKFLINYDFQNNIRFDEAFPVTHKQHNRSQF
ncbi:hypothetical protein AtNW77_Chr1g0049691 [Arabidopsis thaliana]